NFENRWKVPSSAIGGGGSKNSVGKKGTVEISDGYVYAFSHWGTAIGGGSKKKAEELFKVALANTEGTGDEFYVNLIYSQFLYDQKDKAGAATYFQKAYDIQPDSKKLALVKLLNDNGYTLFYYTLNRAKVEKKLGL
ncbi:MAG: tetratricopeptide repeat protein, partial [Spirochaetaceae bacterium]|nr:tetratricopeptide repeat protein [Spirochaetaceae bacterium]